MINYRLAFASACCAALLAACATENRAPNGTRSTALRCDDAVSRGVGFGQGQARAVAVASMRNQVGDVRGYLVSQGARHVRSTNQSVTCRSHAFGGGLVQCTAVTRFCGR